MHTENSADDRTILVLNSGSSSLKFGLFRHSGDDESLLLEGSAEGIGRDDGSLRIKAPDGQVLVQQERVLESQVDALQKLAQVLTEQHHARPSAVGHRVVHGGPHLREHQRITADVRRQLHDAVHFAPLHIPPALALIDEAEKIFDDAPHFACFDTAFHATLPPRAAHLALPRRYAEAGVMRYGFHGLSYESLVTRLGADLPARAVFAHLGNGSSVCALRDGQSIDTSMGLTPTGGVPMGTRSGDLDPGVLLYLMRVEKLDAGALETLLNRQSGLAGYADGESDMQALEKTRSSGRCQCVTRARCVRDRRAQDHRRLCGVAGRNRFAGVYRRHRRAQRRDSQARVRRAGFHGANGKRSGGQGEGDSHRRGKADRAALPHAAAANADRLTFTLP
ncbi:acetate kinase [Paraburkholderia sp. BL9I2N2]|nr:acetate kinase [Paraburkholderia sp. BL9I2N2]